MSIHVALALVAMLAAACSDSPERARCPQCGMFADLAPRWNAGLEEASGTRRTFDTPKCLLRYRLAHPDTRNPWVLDYYGQTRLPLGDARLVAGSDVLGPMGPDLVPLSADRVEAFVADHGGRAYVAADVMAEILDSLRVR